MSRAERDPAKVIAEIKDAPSPKPCADCLRVNALLGLSHAREEELKRDLAIRKASISMLQQEVLRLQQEALREHPDGHKCRALINMTEKRDRLRKELLDLKDGKDADGLYAFDPDWVVLPWDHIAEAMEHYGYTSQELKITDAEMAGLATGSQAITPAMAQHLEEVLKRPAKLWLRLEANYRLGLAEGKTQT